jgi:hypothetical protein
MECLDQVRKIHGNDCMIVHSFKQPDSYCIIVAVESADVKTGAQLVSSVVGTTVSQASPVSSKDGLCDAVESTAFEKKPAVNDSREHTTAEISPTILELARKLGALSEEAKGPKEHSVDVSQKEFEALNFSEVLNDVVSQSNSIENKTRPMAIEALTSDSERQVGSHAFFDVGETHTSRTPPPLSDSAMLFSSIIGQCIKMDPRGNFVGT